MALHWHFPGTSLALIKVSTILACCLLQCLFCPNPQPQITGYKIKTRLKGTRQAMEESASERTASSSVRSAEKNRVSTCEFADRVARTSIAEYEKRRGKIDFNGFQTVLAAIRECSSDTYIHTYIRKTLYKESERTETVHISMVKDLSCQFRGCCKQKTPKKTIYMRMRTPTNRYHAYAYTYVHACSVGGEGSVYVMALLLIEICICTYSL